jgi:hypothetical protein
MTERNLVRRVNALRLAVVTRRPLRLWTSCGGLVVFALGLRFSLDRAWTVAAPGFVVGGVLLWVAGAWVFPWTRDAYFRRVIRVWRDWAAHTQGAYNQFSQRQTKFGARLAALSPPSESIAAHERLVSLVAESDRLRTQSAIPFPERVRQVATTQQTARQAKDALVRDTRAGEPRYAAALGRLFEDRSSEYATAALRSEHAAEQAIQKLRRMRPPAAAAAEHETLVAAFGAQLEAARKFHAASRAADPERVAGAAGEWEAAVAALRAAAARVADLLDYTVRWPAFEDRAAPDASHR